MSLSSSLFNFPYQCSLSSHLSFRHHLPSPLPVFFNPTVCSIHDVTCNPFNIKNPIFLSSHYPIICFPYFSSLIQMFLYISLFFRLDFIQFSFLTPFTIHISDNHFRSLSLSLILSFSPFVLGQKRSLSFVLRRLSFSLSVNRFSIYLSLSVSLSFFVGALSISVPISCQSNN